MINFIYKIEFHIKSFIYKHVIKNCPKCHKPLAFRSGFIEKNNYGFTGKIPWCMNSNCKNFGSLI